MSVTYSRRTIIAMLLLAVSCLISPALAGSSAPVSSHGSEGHAGSGIKSQAYWDSSLRVFSSQPREGQYAKNVEVPSYDQTYQLFSSNQKPNEGRVPPGHDAKDPSIGAPIFSSAHQQEGRISSEADNEHLNLKYITFNSRSKEGKFETQPLEMVKEEEEDSHGGGHGDGHGDGHHGPPKKVEAPSVIYQRNVRKALMMTFFFTFFLALILGVLLGACWRVVIMNDNVYEGAQQQETTRDSHLATQSKVLSENQPVETDSGDLKTDRRFKKDDEDLEMAEVSGTKSPQKTPY